jgi:hypothetical protein
VALVSDAGAPGICDPGARLVRAARLAGLPVHPLPGPSAVVTALMASGFEASSFTFLGFLPRGASRRREKLESLRNLDHPLVFFIPPHKLIAHLTEMIAVLGPRPALLAREMTKLHEEYLSSTLTELLEEVVRSPRRGEMTLVVGPWRASTGLDGEERPNAGSGDQPGESSTEGNMTDPAPCSRPKAGSASGRDLDDETAAVIEAVWEKEKSAKLTSLELAKRFQLGKKEAYALVNAWRRRRDEEGDVGDD